MLDVNEAPARAVAARVRETGGQADVATLDIRNGQAVGELFDRLRLQQGALDGVVSTPGVNVRKPLLAYSEEEFDRVVSVNLKGAFNVVREAGRVMTEQRRGSIVMFSSIRVDQPSSRARASMPRPRRASCSSCGRRRWSSDRRACG